VLVREGRGMIALDLLTLDGSRLTAKRRPERTAELTVHPVDRTRSVSVRLSTLQVEELAWVLLEVAGLAGPDDGA
jgi:hypothetical protein